MENKTKSTEDNPYLRDSYISIGIALGYINMLSHILGYSTGFCACFNNQAIKEILSLENDPLVMLGIGFANLEKNRRIHHYNEFVFPSFEKEEIVVTYYT